MQLEIRVEQRGAPDQWGIEAPYIAALSCMGFGHLGSWNIWLFFLMFLTPVPACPQLLEVNKQWDQHFRSMKHQYEQKVMEFLGAELRMARGGGMRSS